MKRRVLRIFALIVAVGVLSAVSVGQSGGTGAIAGTITDSSGAVVTGVSVRVTEISTGESRTVLSTGNGTYVAALLKPGTYRVQATKSGFKVSVTQDVAVHVTETAAVNLQLVVGGAAETVNVTTAGELLKTADATLGQVVDEKEVSSLPLVTRNYQQILGLSAGVSAEVFNAADIGRGGVEAPVVAGGSSYLDNNFQMNGVQINDAAGSGHFTGGVATPNPDAIQEFKVQTGQYDAAAGRNSGANVNVVTKGGTNVWHGNAWEFLRNEALDANTYMMKKAGQPRAMMRQNQYGFTLGGPLKKDKLLFFTSYQGTKQKNGIDSNCSSSGYLPLLTNDRSAAALAAAVGPTTAFGGMALTLGPTGPTMVPVTGANVSAQALALFNLKKANSDEYLIPNPQQIVTDPMSGLPEGFSSFSSPCPYNEDQFITNLDWVQSSKSNFAARFFFANSDATFTIPSFLPGVVMLPGSPVKNPQDFRNFSLTHTYLFTNNLVNQAEVGYHRTATVVQQNSPLKWSDIGVNAPSYAQTPVILVLGGLDVGGNGQTVGVTQNTYIFQDTLSWTRGRQSLRFGGGIERIQINQGKYTFPGDTLWLSYPGLMLGASPESPMFPFTPLNPVETISIAGPLARYWREWDANLFVQDDIKVTSRLTVNLGLRFEHLGDPGEIYGRNSTMDPTKINPNPPDGGSVEGYVVSGNFKGTIPSGVINSGNNLGIKGTGQYAINPRIGFAWSLPGTNRFVLRGGYGVYHQKITNQPFLQQIGNLPFNVVQVQNPAILTSFASPFPPDPGPFPQFIPYSPSTSFGPVILDPNMRPPIVQKFSLSLQSQLTKDLVLEVGYAGARATHLIVGRYLNQANLASESNPIRDVTTNTWENVSMRVPYQGFAASTFVDLQTTGFSWDNALQASLSKRFSHGLQFLASYTFSRDLSNSVGSAAGANGGQLLGDSTNPRRAYGPDNFVRPHRFVFSAVYDLPGPKNLQSFAGQVLGGWKLSGVSTIQSGHRLTISANVQTNVYGRNQDFAMLTPGCKINTSGSRSDRVANGWFNSDCQADYPVIGDGIGWGNSTTGIATGPGQVNTDLSIGKLFPIRERYKLEFRTEIFNVFNHPIFGDPDAVISDGPTFGKITTMAANPRIIQFALKFNF